MNTTTTASQALYRIYDGGTQPESALYIRTGIEPNERGEIIMSTEEYNNSGETGLDENARKSTDRYEVFSFSAGNPRPPRIPDGDCWVLVPGHPDLFPE